MNSGSIVLRSEGKKWFPLRPTAEGIHFRRFAEVWHTYANLIDVFRIFLAFVLFWSIAERHHLTSWFLVFANFMLDYLDGPVARAFNQCTYLGATLDWYADVLVNIAQVVWWQQVEPVTALYFGWTFIFAELAVMLLDSIYYVQGRYPVLAGSAMDPTASSPSSSRHAVRVPGTSTAKRIPWLLSLSLCEGSHGSTYRYTNFYAVIWLAFPLALSSICAQIGYAYQLPDAGSLAELLLTATTVSDYVEGAVVLWLYACWTIGVVLSAMFIATEVQMAWFLLSSWFERRDRHTPSKVVAIYDTTQTSQMGGCVVFPFVEAWPLPPSVTMSYGRHFAPEVSLARDLNAPSHPAGNLIRCTVAQLVPFDHGWKIRNIRLVRHVDELLDIIRGEEPVTPRSTNRCWTFASEHFIVITNAAELPVEHMHVPLDAMALPKLPQTPSNQTPSTTEAVAGGGSHTCTALCGAVMSPMLPSDDSYSAVHFYKGTLLRMRRVTTLAGDGGEDSTSRAATAMTTVVVTLAVEGD